MTYKRAALVCSCKVRGEGNSVIFINREILPGPENARICFHILLTTTIICCLFLFVLTLGIGALILGYALYGHTVQRPP